MDTTIEDDINDEATNEETAENLDYEEVFQFGVLPYDFHQQGRRTKCTPELIYEIGVRIARDGATAKEAALLAGISESIYYRWIKRGRKEHIRLEAEGIETEEDEQVSANPVELPYLQLFGVVSKAIPLRKAVLVKRIRKAGEDSRNWTANAWLLERMHPDEFGRKTRIEIAKVPWQEEVIEVIRQGIPFDVVAEKIGDGQARELFERARVKIPGSGTGGDAN